MRISVFVIYVTGTDTVNMSGFNFGTSGSSGGFAFGTPKTTTSTGTSGFTFGTSSSASSTGFSFGAVPNTGSSAAQPSGLFSFSTSGPSSATSSGFSLGTTPTTSTSTAVGLTLGNSTPKFNLNTQTGNNSIGTVQPAQNLAFSFGATATHSQPVSSVGFTFSSKTATNTSSTATTVATTAQSGFGFQSSAFCMAPNIQSVSTTTASAPTQATTIQQPTSLFLKSPDVTSVSTTASTSSTSSLTSLLTTSAPSLFSLSSTATSAALTIKPQTTGVVQTSTSVTVSSSIAGAHSVMTYIQLENLINKWSLELEDQEKNFLQQATQVNAWDRMLIHNGERITTLHREMEKVKMDQKRLDQELDFILAQQKELEDILTPLEESVKEQSGTIYLQHADEEREKTFKLAENIDAQLKRMAQDLKDVIEHLNTSAGPGDTSNPLQQICKILNAHMGSLQWIEQNSSLLQRKVEQVTKECESRRKEQERGYPITFE